MNPHFLHENLIMNGSDEPFSWNNWNYQTFGWDSATASILLYAALEKAGGRNADRAAVVAVIRDWWREPENAIARDSKSTLSARQAAELIYELVVGAGSDLLDSELIGRVVKDAHTNPAAFEGLRCFAFELASQGKAVPPNVAKVLLRPEGAPAGRRPKGQEPWRFNRDYQLGVLVQALRDNTGFGGMGIETKNSALELITEATGQPGDVISKAWRKLPKAKK